MGNYIEQKYSFSTFRTQWMFSGFTEVILHTPNIVKNSGFVQSLYNISKIMRLRIPSWPELHKEPWISISHLHGFNVRWSETIQKLEGLSSSITQGCTKDTVISPMLPSVPVIHWCNRQLRCDGCGTLLE